MYILNNLGFIAHPKTASSSTQRALRAMGAQMYGNHHDVEEEWCRTILDAGGIVFCTVRNPYDIMVSWYFHYMKRRGNEYREPFKTFLPQQLGNPNNYIRKGLFYGAKYANKIVHFENLQEGFNDALDAAGMQAPTLEPFNISLNREERPYQGMYDEQLKSLVKYHFGSELAEFGYTFEEK